MGLSVYENIFTFLFKYRPLVFEQGNFTWGLSRPLLLAVSAAAALALAALLTYRKAAPDSLLRDRIVLIGLRVAVVAVLLFSLLRPTLILKASVPQQNFVGI